MLVAEAMRRKLDQAFAPDRVDIIDDSQRHVGHAGYQPGGESHFRIEVVSTAFEGRSRVDRQRMVYDVLAEELSGGVHALSLKTLTPGEARSA